MQSHRRHGPSSGAAAGIGSSSSGTSSAQAAPYPPDVLPASSGYDDPNRKYHKPPPRNKSSAGQLMQVFGAFALGTFVLGQLLASSETSTSDGTSSIHVGHKSAAAALSDLSPKTTPTVPDGQLPVGVPAKSSSKKKHTHKHTHKHRSQIERPDWMLHLQPPPSPPVVATLHLQDPQYGLHQLTGRHRFAESAGCAVPDAHCVTYLPEVDLNDHVVPDEALAVQSSLMRGQVLRLGGGGHVGFGNRQLRINANGGKVNVVNNGKGPIVRPPPVMGGKVILDDVSVDEYHAILTRAGFNGHPNQDRSIVVAPYLLGASSDESASTSHDFLMALFDGHGERGQVTSELAVRTYPALLAQKMERVPLNGAGDGFAESALREAVTAAYQDIDDMAASVSGAGCTATSILRVGPHLYHINTGDSQSFLGYHIHSKDESGVAFLTTEHKPHLPEERARIEAMGGTVMLPPPAPPGMNMKLSSRVLSLLPNGMQLGLAMSRSIGDPEAGRLGVIATPEITALNLLDVRNELAAKAAVHTIDVDLFAVVASDGIFDHVEPTDVATVLASALYQYGNKPPPGRDRWSPLMAVEDLIMTSSQRWLENLDQAYRDDISLAVSKVII